MKIRQLLTLFKIRYFIFIWIILIILGFLYCKNIKDSLWDADYTFEGISALRFTFSGEMQANQNTPWQTDTQISFSELWEHSDIVIKASVTENRKGKNNCIFSEINILDVFKGDTLETGDCVYVYESCEIFFNRYEGYNGYTAMLPDREYILFLSALKPPYEKFKMTYADSKSYLMTNILYGKISMKMHSDIEVKNFRNDGSEQYKTIMEWDIVPSNIVVLEQYKTIRKQALEFIG